MGPVAFSQFISISPTLTIILWVCCFLLEYSSTKIFFVLLVETGVGVVSDIVAWSKVIFSGMMKLSGKTKVPGGSVLPGVLGNDVFSR